MIHTQNKDIVIYHKDCMDGVASAALWSMYNSNTLFLPIQNNTIESDSLLYILNRILDTNDVNIVFLDFSTTYDNVITLANTYNSVLIIDHHKTFKEISDTLPSLSNLEVIYDESESGATLTYHYLRTITLKVTLYPYVFAEYVKDRDIWNFELPLSKEFSIGLRELIKPNDVNSFIDTVMNTSVNEIIDIGKSIYLDKQVDSITHISKLKKITLDNIEFYAINATSNISEIGNAICTKYNKPALMYFILPSNEVIFSMRSIDKLSDVSIIAKAYGGGGHRNACGFKGDLTFLSNLLQ